MKNNKEQDNDWFRLESNKEGTKWFGKCWYIQDLLKYEFEIEFDVSRIEIKRSKNVISSVSGISLIACRMAILLVHSLVIDNACHIIYGLVKSCPK